MMSRHIHATVMAAVALGLAACVAAQTRPVGQLLNVAGRVEVQRAGKPALKGTLLLPLQSGDHLKVGDGGSAEVVLFQNGARLGLPAGCAVVVTASALKPLSGPPPQARATLSSAFV